MRELKRKVPESRKRKIVLQPPIWTGHADFCNPFEFIAFMRLIGEHDFDVMLEAKSKDLALLRLQRDLQRYAPEVGEMFGLEASASLPKEPTTIEVMSEDAAGTSPGSAG